MAAADVVVNNVHELHVSPNINLSQEQQAKDVRPKTVRFYCSEVPNFSDFFYSKKFSDVNLVAGGRKIAAHRSRLASVSPFLATLFASDTSEVSTVIIPDVSFSAVNILINFIYTGFIRITKKEVKTVLEVACMLGIDYPIDIEETEVGIVRIKPSEKSRKRCSTVQFHGISPIRKARIEKPRVVIYEGAQSISGLDSLIESSKEDETHETVTILEENNDEAMDVEEVITLSEDQPTRIETPCLVEIHENSSDCQEIPTMVMSPAHRASPRPRIKKTKTRNDLLMETQNQSPLSAVLISGDESNDVTKDSPVPTSSANSSAENLENSYVQPIVVSVEGNKEICNEPQTLATLALRATNNLQNANVEDEHFEDPLADLDKEVPSVAQEENREFVIEDRNLDPESREVEDDVHLPINEETEERDDAELQNSFEENEEHAVDMGNPLNTEEAGECSQDPGLVESSFEEVFGQMNEPAPDDANAAFPLEELQGEYDSTDETVQLNEVPSHAGDEPQLVPENTLDKEEEDL
ncbi:uncharacterized protein LOC132201154 [Neocloeon triangulifer]|uniref:uncharacterized protein LOC132201154 n=1 Tax=Neocloeon triangulifer TaxID=2078957 RepID=UPI00286F8596|nr:uncharacterized protein LOC132201154 [Neocloeon triangulifer]